MFFWLWGTASPQSITDKSWNPAKPSTPARDNDALIRRVFRVDNLVGKHFVFGKRSDFVCFYEGDEQERGELFHDLYNDTIAAKVPLCLEPW